jgi:chemotaxis protein MotA
MDVASIIGLVLAIGLIASSVLVGSVPLTAFIDVPSFFVVFGGSTAAVMIAFPLKRMLSAPTVAKNAFFNKPVRIPQLIDQIVSLADTARRDGLLALESRLDEIDNSFITLGLEMAVDGTRADVIEDVMRTQIDAVATRHRDGRSILEQLGRFAPAYGMIGTLLGLIMMLSDMRDPSTIGAGMAVALTTTLYGALAANVLFLPLAEKLRFMSKQEMLVMEIVLRGILAIQSGENPRVIEQKLNTFLPPKLRGSKKRVA